MPDRRAANISIGAIFRSVAAAAILLVLGGLFGQPSVAHAQENVSGVLSVRWGDPGPSSAARPQSEVVISDRRGRETELVGDLSEALDLDGERVEVEGEPVGDGRIRVEDVRAAGYGAAGTASGSPVPPVSGSRPVATILCRFADSPAVFPRERPYFEGVMGSAEPGMNHYWREASYGKANLDGSAVFGPYVLPLPRSSYIVGGLADLEKLASDCTAAADADVSFPRFTNVNLMFDDELDGFAWGGSALLRRDGQERSYGVTWLPPWGYENAAALAHEMGHSFGLPHSSGPRSLTYDSRWDVMSDVWGNCLTKDPTYGCVGVGTIAHHKDRIGWIPAGRKYNAAPGANPGITLSRLARPGAGGYLLAQIPIRDSGTHFYTVEARKLDGYDRNLPGEAVVIHEIDAAGATGLDPVAKVVDPDGNLDPNDAGAMWFPGETFDDPRSGISVEVTGQTPDGFTVRITAPPDTRIVSGPSRFTRLSSARFSFASGEDASFECSLDGAGFVGCSSPRTYSGLAQGRHILRVRAIWDGRTDPTPVVFRWTVDMRKPVIKPSSPKAGAAVRDRTPAIRAVVRDGQADLVRKNVLLYLGGKKVRSFTYDRASDRLAFTPKKPLGYGRHTVRVVAKDSAGNTAVKRWSFSVERKTWRG